MKIQDIGERKVIEKIWSFIGRDNEDEDVHFLTSGERYILLAIDTINENFHFERWWDPELIGRFLVEYKSERYSSQKRCSPGIHGFILPSRRR